MSSRTATPTELQKDFGGVNSRRCLGGSQRRTRCDGAHAGPPPRVSSPTGDRGVIQRPGWWWFLEWLLPLLVQVLVAGPLYHPPHLTSQNMTPTTKSWVGQWE